MKMKMIRLRKPLIVVLLTLGIGGPFAVQFLSARGGGNEDNPVEASAKIVDSCASREDFAGALARFSSPVNFDGIKMLFVKWFSHSPEDATSALAAMPETNLMETEAKLTALVAGKRTIAERPADFLAIAGESGRQRDMATIVFSSIAVEKGVDALFEYAERIDQGLAKFTAFEVLVRELSTVRRSSEEFRKLVDYSMMASFPEHGKFVQNEMSRIAWSISDEDLAWAKGKGFPDDTVNAIRRRRDWAQSSGRQGFGQNHPIWGIK